MSRIFLIPLGLVLAMFMSAGPAPERAVAFDFTLDVAEARPHGRGGGFRGRAQIKPRGARSRPAARPRPSTRPTNRPGTRPNRPALRPDRPAQRPNRPGRPPGTRPPGNRPPGTRPPAHRPPGARPPRPLPPIAGRPPGYRPPHWRPPAWRPPAYRPPYVRPPHYRWGRYYWYPSWGWYFTAAVAGATLVYVATLPEDKDCQPVRYENETLYLCDGVLYRSTLYQSEQVYEIVSSSGESISSSGASDSATDVGRELRLTSPYMRGERVRAVQQALNDQGFNVGTADGVFGPGTDRSLREFQRVNGLSVTGVVDEATAQALGV